MARTSRLALATAVLSMLSAIPSLAAPATPEEAVRLSALFERYVGHPAAGEPSSVTVVPKGESYAVTLDLKRAAGGLGSFGVAVDPYVASATLTPLPDGTWAVKSSDSPPLVVHIGAQTVSLAAATNAFEGVFDPKLQALSSVKQDQTGYTYAQTAPTVIQNRRVDRVATTATAVSAEGGTVAIGGHSALTGMAADILFKSASPDPNGGAGSNPAVPPPSTAGTAVSYTIPTGTVDVALGRVRTGSLLDLWAFLVAHPTHDSLSAAQDELKALLHSGLPFLDSLRESGSLDTVAITTPVGVVSMKALGGNLDLSGLGSTGKAAGALSITDLAVPPGQLPPWSAGLVPTGLDLHLAADGFHFGEAANATVESVDLKKDVIITPEQKEAAAHLFWPAGGIVALAPSRITTRVLDLRMVGQATLGPKLAGSVTVTGKGLDTEIAALQAQAATDPGAGQVLGPLVLAKNLAKPDPDGGLVWLIEFGDGPVRINGATLQ